MRTALARLHMRTHTWTWWQRGFFIVLVPWLALLAWGATWQSGSNRMLAYFASAVVLLLWLGAITQPTSRPTSSVQKAAPSAATFTSEPLLPTVSAAAALPATTTTQPTTTSWPTATSQSATRSTIISRPTVTPRAVAPPTTRRRPAPPSPPTTRRRPTTTAPQGRCDPHYPGVCIPPYPPDLDCDEVGYRNFRVLAPDPHGFDGNDNDGIGCET